MEAIHTDSEPLTNLGSCLLVNSKGIFFHDILYWIHYAMEIKKSSRDYFFFFYKDLESSKRLVMLISTQMVVLTNRDAQSTKTMCLNQLAHQNHSKVNLFNFQIRFFVFIPLQLNCKLKRDKCKETKHSD